MSRSSPTTCPPTPCQAAWLARVETLRLRVTERLFLGAFGFEARLALYPPGARCAAHLDRFVGASHRGVTLMLYLDAGWKPGEGCALRLDLPASHPCPIREVLPQGGTLVAFLSGEIRHEVMRAIRERLSVVGWLTVRRRGGRAARLPRRFTSSGS